MYDFITENDNSLMLSCYIQAGASKSRLCGEFNGNLKLQIQCPPVDGKANNEIIKFLSKTFNVSKSKVGIIKGEKQKTKIIKISGISKKDFVKILEELENSD